jgi:hypothetical protein
MAKETTNGDLSQSHMGGEEREYEAGIKPSDGMEVGRVAATILGRVLQAIGVAIKQTYIRSTTRIPLAGYNGVNAQELDKRMAKINWNKDYYSPEVIQKGRQKARLERDIMRVNSILRDLKKLSDSGDYKAEELRWKLQHKYWTYTKMQPQRANTTAEVVPFADATAILLKKARSIGHSQSEGTNVKPAHKTKEDVNIRRDRIARKEVARTNPVGLRQRSKRQSMGY